MRELSTAEINMVGGGMKLDDFDPKAINVYDQRTYRSTIRSYGFWEGTWIWIQNHV